MDLVKWWLDEKEEELKNESYWQGAALSFSLIQTRGECDYNLFCIALKGEKGLVKPVFVRKLSCRQDRFTSRDNDTEMYYTYITANFADVGGDGKVFVDEKSDKMISDYTGFLPDFQSEKEVVRMDTIIVQKKTGLPKDKNYIILDMSGMENMTNMSMGNPVRTVEIEAGIRGEIRETRE